MQDSVFSELRKKARILRNTAIIAAREEYEKTLIRIAELEQALFQQRPVRERKVSASVDRVIPSDRSFTLLDIMTGLEAIDPSRLWRKRTVENYIDQIRRKGLIRRIRRHGKGTPAVYARIGVEVPTKPFDNLRLVDSVAKVLGDRSMTPTELVVALTEAGYETVMTKKKLRHEIDTVMKRNPDRFRREGEKWCDIKSS